MCGIAGFFHVGEKTAAGEAVASVFFPILWALNDSRGGHAAGMAALREKKWRIYKRGELATDALERGSVRRLYRGARVVIAHTRFGTGGDPSDNRNNHPFTVRDVIAVHNGVLPVSLSPPPGYVPQGKCDSEIGTAWIAAAVHEHDSFEEAAKAAAEKLQRGYCFVFARRGQEFLHILRADNPLSIVYYPRVSLVFFSSLPEHLRTAARMTTAILDGSGWRDGGIIRSIPEHTAIRLPFSDPSFYEGIEEDEWLQARGAVSLPSFSAFSGFSLDYDRFFRSGRKKTLTFWEDALLSWMMTPTAESEKRALRRVEKAAFILGVAPLDMLLALRDTLTAQWWEDAYLTQANRQRVRLRLREKEPGCVAVIPYGTRPISSWEALLPKEKEDLRQQIQAAVEILFMEEGVAGELAEEVWEALREGEVISLPFGEDGASCR